VNEDHQIMVNESFHVRYRCLTTRARCEIFPSKYRPGHQPATVAGE
jgi:hypothetical protein